MYNPNVEAEQLKTLSKVTEMLKKLLLTQNNNIICAGDLICYLALNLKVTEEIQFLKKGSVGKIFELKETYNLTDFWRIRNPPVSLRQM